MGTKRITGYCNVGLLKKGMQISEQIEEYRTERTEYIVLSREENIPNLRDPNCLPTGREKDSIKLFLQAFLNQF